MNTSDNTPTICRPTQWTFLPEGEAIFSEHAMTITICDDGGGEYVEVEQLREGMGKIAIDVAEWPALRDSIDLAISQCVKQSLMNPP
jgi:hypothetical protein